MDAAFDVQDLGLRQRRPDHVVQVTVQPCFGRFRVQRLQPVAQPVIATHPRHILERRIAPGGAQRRDVSVALGAGRKRQHELAQKIAKRRRVRIGVGQQTVGDPSVKQPGLLHQVVDEERQLAERGDRFIRRPRDMHLAGDRLTPDAGSTGTRARVG